MSFAATLGQKTVHGGFPLTPAPLSVGKGSPDVIIGGFPAWRATIDNHACPLYDGSKPHVGPNGGIIVPAGRKPTVFINGYPAARMGDNIVEASAPNAIASGVESVLIG